MDTSKETILSLLEQVNDPEIPVLSVVDLGIIRNTEVSADPETGKTTITVFITPTYTGCPAIDAMKMNTRIALLAYGFDNVQFVQVLSPAWTTDWMSEQGKEKLKAFGIAPPQPQQSVCTPGLFQEEVAIPCPRCNSYHTRLISRFGSTACKALYQCNDCQEPFDHFKCH
ncbi:MAG TPA: 1,2-phenylacetyl-CoA epoxidase subunit PaaD [Sediminibacterium sp.]|nr:1,2-phenylacetyl-CoA epoxidase subunit PaaD [Sediminibacterium sp.]